MKRKALVLLAVFCLTGNMWADVNYLHIQTASGWQVLNLDNVNELTFKGNNMVVKGTDNNTVLTVPKTQLVSINVDDDASESGSSGMENIADNKQQAKFAFDAANKTLTAFANGDFAMYAIDGRLLLAIPQVKAGQTIDLSAISGNVILKLSSQTLKTSLK